MLKSHLKSGTALLVSISLITPFPAFAQTAFPCVAPNGDEVTDGASFAQNLIATGNAELTAGTCSQEALAEALDIGGDALAAALAPAEAVVEEAAPAVEETIVEEAAPAEEVAPEAPAEEPAAPAEEPAAPAEEEAAPVEEPAAEAIVEEAAPVEEVIVEEAAPAEEVVPVEEAPVAQEAAPEAEVAAEPVATEEPEAEPAAVEPAAEPVAEEPAATAEPAAEPVETTTQTEAAPAEETTPVTESTAEPAVTEPADAAPVAAEILVPEAGEAGGEVVTDEERQAIAEAKGADQAEPSAAATADAEATEAEVVTETITADDVRTSDQDFATAIGDAASTEAATTESEKGLSSFEKALLLGLGAVVVGTVLNNGDQVIENTGDRIVVERDGELRVLKNDDQLLQRPGAQVQTQTFNDGSTRSVLTYEDGSQVITIRSTDGTVLRRTLIQAGEGTEVVLFDDTTKAEPVDFAKLPTLQALEAEQLPQNTSLVAALQQALLADVGRKFSLQQIRDYKRVRALAPQVEIDAVTFASGSAAIDPNQAEELADLGLTMRDIIAADPTAVFLIEGHTDAVGAASYNLALSDRRAETVALALTEYFAVPPQNLITQGYGEADLKIPVLTNERENRRAVVRNISRLLN